MDHYSDILADIGPWILRVIRLADQHLRSAPLQNELRPAEWNSCFVSKTNSQIGVAYKLFQYCVGLVDL